MKFSEIVEHLGKRGFVTRKSYDRNSYVFFGMDNIGWQITRGSIEVASNGYGQAVKIIEHPNRKNTWTPCLAELKAEDWQIVDLFWSGSKDDYLPFEK